MAINFYPRLALTGGTGGAIDEVDGDDLVDGDVFFTVAGGKFYPHWLDADSAVTEDSPEFIAPDSNAGDKRAVLCGLVGSGLELYQTQASVNGGPDIDLINNNADGYGPNFRFKKLTTGMSASEEIGTIDFISYTGAFASEFRYAGLDVTMEDSGTGTESASVELSAAHAGTFHSVLKFNGISGIVEINDDENDLDFIVNYDSGAAFSIIGSTGIPSLPLAYSHDMNGETIRDLQINNSGELGYDSSVRGIKMNIQPVSDVFNPTDVIAALEPVFYNPKKSGPFGRVDFASDVNRYGFIAEDVYDVLPELTIRDTEGNPRGINWKEMIPFMVAELQLLRKEVDKKKGVKSI